MTVFRFFVWSLACWLILTTASAATGAPGTANKFAMEQDGAEPIIRFTDLDTSFATRTLQDANWKRTDAMPFWSADELGGSNGKVRAVWVRAQFDRASLGGSPLAIYTEGNREQFTLFFNGKEVFRNFGRKADNILGWNRVYLIPIPPDLLRAGTNEILIAVNSNFDLGAGSLRIGPQEALQRQYFWLDFWRTTAPIAANFAMLILSIAAFLLWLARRNEHEHLLLALSGLMWFVRNYDFYAPRMPIEPQIFANLTLYASYFAAASSLSFCLLWMQVNHRHRVITWMFALGLFLGLLHTAKLIPTTMIYVVTLATGFAICSLLFQAIRRAGYKKHWSLFLVTAICMLANIHDLGRTVAMRWWDGLGFYTQPFDGLMFCLAVLIAFGQRSLIAFTGLENVNQDLERRVAAAQAGLAASEGERRNLEVKAALEVERERLMREVHDGIGSNLVTALAVAKKERHPDVTIELLSRAVSDLKITVDSLDPLGGDILALLGNLRHRMEADLMRAGISIRWNVQNCSPIPWIDPANALQFLRLAQEAVSNVLSHSRATEISFTSQSEERDNRQGVALTISDNGRGFRATQQSKGRGLSIMQERARSLGAIFGLDSRPNRGTRVEIWLPFERGL